MKAGFDVQPLVEYLTAGARILTANNRLTRTLLEAWGNFQAEQQQHVWEVPAVSSLSVWLEHCWQRLLDLQYPPTLQGIIASTQQERLLWRQIIEETETNSHSLAEHAQQAYQIVRQWRIDLHQLEEPLLSWLKRFEARLRDLDLLSSADRDEVILRAFAEGWLPVEKQLLLIGFQSHTPLEQALFKAAATDCISLTPPWRNNSQLRIALDDLESELSAAANWARDLLQQQPGMRVGVVVPQLSSCWRQTERIFRSCFEPHCWQPGQPEHAPRHYNISAGIPLSETPIIAAAFALLALNNTHLPLEECRKLLYSPFWGGAEALESRTLTDKYLTEHGNPNPSSTDFRYWLRQAEETYGHEDLAPRLDKSATLYRQAPGKTLFSSWVKLFNEQLDKLGWPGYRTLTSNEYQQLQHWQQIAEQAFHYDEILNTIPCTVALTHLQRLIAAVVFQAESPPADLQILGLLESASIQFDRLWVVGLDDSQWPSPTRLNPLLPPSLQQQLATPRASPQRELSIAETLLRDLCACATEIIFSHSRRDGERELAVSGLIQHIPETSLQALGITPTYAFQPHESVELEAFPDSYGPSLLETGEQPSGGTAVFRDQALCPFNSFARHRLGAQMPAEPTLGLSPADRGKLLHDVLEAVWAQLKDQQTLLSLDQTSLETLLEQVVEQTLKPWQSRRKRLFGPRFLRNETLRLKQLLRRWLDLEKTRAPFTVTALEQQLETTYAGIPLRLRIDRIDRDNNGRLILIDYKTRNASITSWFGDRPQEPQLPLYTLTSEIPVAATSFALLNANQCEFRGIGETAELLPRLLVYGEKHVPDAESLRTQWDEALTHLANEFKEGYAAVVFEKPDYADRQRELLPLNRWYGEEEV